MRLKGFLLILLSLFCTYSAFAQSKSELTQSRILILLDESSSMIQKWPSGKEKYKAADELILRLMDSIYAINSNVEFSLRVFGHQYTVEQNNCYDTKNEVPFSRDNRTQMSLRLEDIHPLGVTPIAYALMQAAKYDLVDEDRNAYSIVLITDGGESCGGDICEVMKKLMKYKVFFKPYIVSLEDDPALKTTYSCMGDFLQVTKDADMPKAVSTIVTAFRPLIRITKEDYKQIQTIAANAPSVLKVSIPEIKVTEPPRETPVPKPVKADTVVLPVVKIKDTVGPKPVSKIKVDEAPAKLPTENIPALVMARKTLLYVPAPAFKKFNLASLPTVAVIVPPAGEEIGSLRQSSPKPFKITVAPPKTISTIQSLPVPVMQIPSTLAADNIDRVTPSQPRLLATAAPAITKLKTVQPPVKLPPVVVDTPVAPKNKVEKIDRLPLASFSRIPTLFVFGEKAIVPATLPPLPPLKINLPKPPVSKTVAKEPEGPKKADYRIDSKEDAKETTVEIYITNGKGKFYPVTPQMLLLDPATRQIVKTFYRTVDANGNPDPLTTLPEGTYNIALSAARRLEVDNVKIVPNKKNKITVVVPPTTLSFAYENAPDRPVTEFSAEVIERNKAQGRVIVQKCTDRLEYDPGDYHITINTFPVTVRNAYVDFLEDVITILQPGFIKFVAEPQLHTAMLYKQEGDKFLYFHTFDPNDPAYHHLRIQPGMYQVHFKNGPGGKLADDVVVSFVVKANQEVTIELKK